ncbi:uncharacterized protein LOC135097471 [Scylla paramamosain]|uniref:uncharacterized protein LOC135097471 n=1 Tax=Scylla paramamosain TaxID=85552 RepID=UPI003082E1A8
MQQTIQLSILTVPWMQDVWLKENFTQQVDPSTAGRQDCSGSVDIESSLRQWVEAETDMLRNLTTHFPAYSKIVSYAQLQGIIRNFNAVMNDCNMKEMNIFPSSSSINQLISDSLMEFSRI